MNMTNNVSVVIPTYNLSDLLTRSIKSALAATSSVDEVLVIDDGSTDDTPAVVRQFGDTVRYIRIEKNSGRGVARNLGIRLAKCPFVAFLDHDDEWLPDKIDLQRRVMQTFPEVVFCFSNLLTKFQNGKIIHDALSSWRTNPNVGCPVSPPTHLREILGPGIPFSSITGLPEGRADFNIYVGDIYPALMDVCYATNSAVMVRKELAGASFRYEEDLPLMEDWELFARLAKIGPAAYLDCELAIQGVHAGPRGTSAPDITHTTTRIALLQSIWGADERFLTAHSARYQSLLKTQYLRRARFLIGMGRWNEAKEDLKLLGGPYRLLASLPSGLARNILGVRRGIKRLLKLK